MSNKRKSRLDRMRERTQKNAHNPVVQRKIGREIQRLESQRIDAIYRQQQKENQNG